MSKTYRLQREQLLPVSIEEAWDFFSSPKNLSAITPEKLKFKILSASHGDIMYAGQIIEYTVRPVMNIPIYWMTEITQVVKHKFFIDEQRFGPYSFWHHQHHFEETTGGVSMTDIVHYRLPLGFLGNIANDIMVGKQLREIFDYRVEAVNKKWPYLSLTF